VKQAEFETRYSPEWQRFAAWLKARERQGKALEQIDENGYKESEVPAAYRRICTHFSLAQDRHYSPSLTDELHVLVMQGHQALYGTQSPVRQRLVYFLLADFPRLVRDEWRLVLLATVLFFGPLLSLIAVLQWFPDAVYLVLSPRAIAQIQEMYNPANQQLGMRDSDTNVAMFGFYIWNNVRIGFQTYATGLVFCLGSFFFLLFNGVHIGTVAGHLTQIGYGEPLWSFVAGHSAMELLAIVISGAAGIRLGLALLAPGALSRKAALVLHGRQSVKLMFGAAFMFAVAALIEAFWSPLKLADPTPKYVVGVFMWLLVLVWLLFSGRRRGT
jgi:uncharacterized membrane protein SpoIIM required for sporulation